MQLVRDRFPVGWVQTLHQGSWDLLVEYVNDPELW